MQVLLTNASPPPPPPSPSSLSSVVVVMVTVDNNYDASHFRTMAVVDVGIDADEDVDEGVL